MFIIFQINRDLLISPYSSSVLSDKHQTLTVSSILGRKKNSCNERKKPFIFCLLVKTLSAAAFPSIETNPLERHTKSDLQSNKSPETFIAISKGSSKLRRRLQ